MMDYESDDQDVTTEGNDGTTPLNTYLDYNYETFDYSSLLIFLLCLQRRRSHLSLLPLLAPGPYLSPALCLCLCPVLPLLCILPET